METRAARNEIFANRRAKFAVQARSQIGAGKSVYKIAERQFTVLRNPICFLNTKWQAYILGCQPEP